MSGETKQKKRLRLFRNPFKHKGGGRKDKSKRQILDTVETTNTVESSQRYVDISEMGKLPPFDNMVVQEERVTNDAVQPAEATDPIGRTSNQYLQITFAPADGEASVVSFDSPKDKEKHDSKETLPSRRGMPSTAVDLDDDVSFGDTDSTPRLSPEMAMVLLIQTGTDVSAIQRNDAEALRVVEVDTEFPLDGPGWFFPVDTSLDAPSLQDDEESVSEMDDDTTFRDLDQVIIGQMPIDQVPLDLESVHEIPDDEGGLNDDAPDDQALVDQGDDVQASSENVPPETDNDKVVDVIDFEETQVPTVIESREDDASSELIYDFPLLHKQEDRQEAISPIDGMLNALSDDEGESTKHIEPVRYAIPNEENSEILTLASSNTLFSHDVDSYDGTEVAPYSYFDATGTSVVRSAGSSSSSTNDDRSEQGIASEFGEMMSEIKASGGKVFMEWLDLR